MPSGNWEVQCSLGPTSGSCHGDVEIPARRRHRIHRHRTHHLIGPNRLSRNVLWEAGKRDDRRDVLPSHRRSGWRASFHPELQHGADQRGTLRGFGAGWNTSFEGRLRVMDTRWIEIRLSDGYPFYYHDG